jgi:hypothetical protein
VLLLHLFIELAQMCSELFLDLEIASAKLVETSCGLEARKRV